MKKKLNEILDVYTVLQNLSKESSPFKISYWISRNLSELKDTTTFFAKERDKMFAEYLYQDEDGNYFKSEGNNLIRFNLKDKSEEYSEKFSNTFNELLIMECDINPYLISLNDLMESDIAITPQEISIIECLIEED